MENTNLEIIEPATGTKAIETTEPKIHFVIDPIMNNLMTKSDSTVTRHTTELTAFGTFLHDVMKRTDISTMNQMKQLMITDNTWNRDHAMKFLMEWATVTADDIEAYKAYLTYNKGFRTTTISQAIYIIKSYARIAFDTGAININDLTRIEHITGINGSEATHIDEHRVKTADRDRHNVGGNVTTLTKKQISLLKFDHPETLTGKRDALLFCILLDHGLRISDAIGLTMDDIDMTEHMIHVTTKKTGVTLNLAMTDDVYNAFCEYFRFFTPAPSASIWTGVNKHGTAQGTWGKHSAQMEITKVASTKGIENLSAHDLRHCWTDRALEGGSNLVAVQQAGGWKSIQMVSRYATKKAVSNSGITLK